MSTGEIILLVGLILNTAAIGVILYRQFKPDMTTLPISIESLNQALEQLLDKVENELEQLGTRQVDGNKYLANNLNDQVESIRRNNTSTVNEVRLTLKTEIDTLRALMGEKLNEIRSTTDQKINDINLLVNEKLTETLSKRLNESFSSLNDNFNKVQQELGKMQALADDVSGLKTVLTNTKTRGIFGEVQLDRILSDYLLPNQFKTNVEIKPRSGERVEFAAILPGDGAHEVLLPIDAKFPMVSYENMLDAIENGDQDATKRFSNELHNLFRKFAKDIHDKYIDVPTTTDYAIMFLPSESIFVEALKNGTSEAIRNDYHIVIAGPSNMAVILNTLQMGFKAVQMKNYSTEVWRVLAKVKNEFEKFSIALEETQKSIAKAGDNLDKLVGTRTRQLSRQLKDVEKGLIDQDQSKQILLENSVTKDDESE